MPHRNPVFGRLFDFLTFHFSDLWPCASQEDCDLNLYIHLLTFVKYFDKYFLNNPKTCEDGNSSVRLCQQQQVYRRVILAVYFNIVFTW